ncbi:MAG: hypothetical protein L0332_01905 [Chloroflexi bacterium]|nr:hypothetical protein [Chloroflexota bacterium]MCI0580881.1 hypothetical protein [Chloroflexota bacterium]MCI0649729.1 hypothetical protein [Chloroflexota bacterium]MCI0725468.1 hypothetical protein [Chloroflexota bacterium]
MAEMTAPTGPTRRASTIPWPFIVIVFLTAAAVLSFTGPWPQLQATGVDRLISWAILIAVMALFLGLIGRATTGRWLGVLIDSGYKMSLSRLQIVLWSILVLSAYLTIAMPRILGNLVCEPADDECEPAPLQITFPSELVLAMGISAASFAGSNLIQSNKKNRVVEIREASLGRWALEEESAQKARDEASAALEKAKTAANDALLKKQQTENDMAQLLQEAQNALDQAATDEARQEAEAALRGVQRLAEARRAAADKVHRDAVTAVQQAEAVLAQSEATYQNAAIARQRADTEREGLLHRNSDPSQATWSDLFRGNEVGNYMLIDMSKVQMFFFTIIVLVAYAAALAALLRNGPVLLHPLGVDLPPFSDSLNTLLAISHGAYLSVKTVDHTKVAG